ncbi:hypothetical protein AY601_1338 [Pedobacter cryoconitis]|uniref:Uncharacterized protein n=1 Tax=Pedobacter cryoconitis TaxID=188932 RepID=A0A127VA71_9SPHI|nr:hypothetical protein [Pedobacter cryoconitis]AMP98256.1 hypothetical protein AY601_1338 [Pedobacter cryoconitis]
MKEALFNDILTKPINYTTSKWVLERIPFIFNDDLDLYINWKERLSKLIGVDSRAIVITGSSSVGYSLNPVKNFKQFSATSDIDVAIISDHYFDIAWHFLRNIGTKYHRLKQKEKNAIDDHRTRLIYYGTIATDKIVHLLPFGTIWLEAMVEMMTVEPTLDKSINFRIYKDFESLKSYQNISVGLAKDQLLMQQ